MKNILYLLFLILLSFTSCVQTDEVINITKVIDVDYSITVYIDYNNDRWICNQAVIYDNGIKHVYFPIQYQLIILPGTLIQYNNHYITKYYNGTCFQYIDWDNTIYRK